MLDLAIALREDGVDVILDKWDLKEGQDAYKFMEQMVSNPEVRKVAIICDHKYAAKVIDRSGGVGAETQIISPEIYTKEDQTKFVVIVAANDAEGKPYLPVYYQSRIYVDLSDNDLYAKNYEQLLRWIYDKPVYIKPPVGSQPGFLTDPEPSKLGTSASFRRALDAIRTRKDFRVGAVSEYFDRLTQGFESLRLEPDGGEFDDKVTNSIEEFLPYRNEALEIFLALSRYENTPESYRALHRFLERLLLYPKAPEHLNQYREWDFDNFRFIVHELFLYAIAALLKYERFDGVGYLLRHHYYSESGRNRNGTMEPFSAFREYMQSFEHRNKRLKIGKLSLHALMLQERAKSSGLTFNQLMQADFTLYIRDCIDCLREQRDQRWWPETLLYARGSGPFEIYARSQSLQYFEGLKQIFDIGSKKDLEPLFDAYKRSTGSASLGDAEL